MMSKQVKSEKDKAAFGYVYILMGTMLTSVASSTKVYGFYAAAFCFYFAAIMTFLELRKKKR